MPMRNFVVPEKPKAFELGDGVSVDIVVTDKDGHKIEAQSQENTFLRDPRQALPPEVAAEFIGKKDGDTFTKTVEHTAHNRAGKEVTHVENYAVTVKEIKIKALPQLDDEFAKDVGDFASLTDLRQRIQDDLNNELERRKRGQAMEKTFRPDSGVQFLRSAAQNCRSPGIPDDHARFPALAADGA